MCYDSFFGHSYSRIRSFLKIVMSYDLATLHEWWRKGVIVDLLMPSSAYLVFERILWLNLDTSCIVRQEGMALWFFLIFRQTLSHCWGYVATELFVVMFHWTFYDCVTLQLCGLGGKLLFSIFFRGWLFTARGRVRERCSEVRLRRLRILVHWPELFLNLQLGPLLVVLKVHISCAGSVMGCVGIYFGNLEFQLYCVKNHASTWKWMTYIFSTGGSEYVWVLHKYKETPLTECAFPFSSAILWSCAILSDR